MTHQLADLLDIARTAVQLGTRVLETAAVRQVTAKGPRDVVTDLDLSIEQQILAFLEERTPGIDRYSEEAGGDPARPRRRWVLDPVDGTVNLVHGLPLFGVSLALTDGVRPLLGVISLPALRRTYWGAAELGAWCNNEAIAPSAAANLADAMVAIGDYGTDGNAEERNAVALALHAALAPAAGKVRMLGSAAADLAFVADGTVDTSITLSNRDWDMAAGVAIARAAGACATDTDGTPYDLASRSTIVTAPGLTDAVLGTLRQVTAGTTYA